MWSLKRDCQIFSPYSLLQKRLKVDTNCEHTLLALLRFVGTGVLDCPLNITTFRGSRGRGGARSSRMSRWDLKGPLASHSRRVSLDTLVPSAPCFGSFASKKRYLIVFSCSPTTSFVGRGRTKHTAAKGKADAMHLLLLL